MNVPPPEKAAAPASPDSAPRQQELRQTQQLQQLQQQQAFVRRYLRTLGAGNDLEDLVQETFVVVLERPFEHRADVATRAFLRQTARYLFLRRHRGTLPQVEVVDEVWDRLCGDDDSGNTYVEALRECMQQLDERSRQLIDATYRDDLGREQTARKLSMRPDGVKSALRRIRKALGKCVERRRQQ